MLVVKADVHGGDALAHTLRCSHYDVATSKEHAEVVELLVGAGAEASVAGHDEDAALARVVRKDHLDAARVLLAAAANVHAHNTEGGTPLL